MTRGRCGSLFDIRMTFAFTTPRRFSRRTRRRFMKIGIVIVVILLILALILGSSYVGRRNQMAIKRDAVNAAWAQVDVVLQRRADLIPNIVMTVKGFAVHEEHVFSEIAHERSA